MKERTPTIVRANSIVPQAKTRLGAQNSSTAPDSVPEPEALDFGDSTIVPGLNDAHIHLALTAGDALHLDLFHETVGTVPALLDTIAAEVRAASAGTWVKGSRYDDEKTGIVLRDDLARTVSSQVTRSKTCSWVPRGRSRSGMPRA